MVRVAFQRRCNDQISDADVKTNLVLAVSDSFPEIKQAAVRDDKSTIKEIGEMMREHELNTSECTRSHELLTSNKTAMLSKTFSRNATSMCFGCRFNGHMKSQCPNMDETARGLTLCYKCRTFAKSTAESTS